jgi:hypothetical protein
MQALREAETLDLLHQWGKSHEFAGKGEPYDAEQVFAAQGLLLVALVNAGIANSHDFDMLVRGRLLCSCDGPYLEWRHATKASRPCAGSCQVFSVFIWVRICSPESF